jgi:hypothetical protein
MEFCKICHSLLLNDSCINKKCKNHGLTLLQLATDNQICLIKDLKEEMEDESEIDYDSITKEEASELIKELIERKNLGGNDE